MTRGETRNDVGTGLGTAVTSVDPIESNFAEDGSMFKGSCYIYFDTFRLIIRKIIDNNIETIESANTIYQHVWKTLG